eukprot:gnl/TRDRNA2_/TRDRNA2_143958_c0_seq1.p1 gnl/TRDRNA2_/TRDRNA2_143958_c0~~gnl/TRDRNA2_/TRDRNA2_143958_c0_seq1.p1  ORF type:complete len:345 (+),score=32.11 gnl/TRDRNA2_/TRDRNA2_143958_c0_seq1:53-1036(+)
MAGVVIKLIIGCLYQGWVNRELMNWVTEGFNSGVESMKAPLATWIPVPTWQMYLMLAIPEFIDPDLDAANAGQSWSLPSSKLLEFGATWQHVPVIGQTVVKMGLPGILTMLVCGATLVQLIEFNRKMSSAQQAINKWPKRSDTSIAAAFDRVGVWMELQHACDAGGILALAETLHALARVELQKKVEASICQGEDPGFTHAGRSTAFRTKVLAEASPSLWFSVSLLALSVEGASWTRIVLMIISILASMHVIVKATVNEFGGCIEAIRVGWIWAGFGNRIDLGAVFRFTILTLNTELFLASVVRFCGVQACKSHVFNFSSGCFSRRP